jgi:hypothetical protein
VQPHDFHPIFFGGAGNSCTKLADQAAVLFCAVTGITRVAAHTILGLDHKAVERVYVNNELARTMFVEEMQPKIQFGVGQKWKDIEADEVDLGKGLAEDGGGKLTWEQWGGLVERGAPHTLVLTRLTPKKTSARAPGPGPIKKRDWSVVANKYLKGKDVILHTDGARAYRLKVAGVIHDNVVHKKKRVLLRGKMRWVLPKYVKTFVHKLPGGKTLRVKGGTQIIDRCWKHIRAHIGQSPKKPGSNVIRRKIRSAQWEYWNKNQDLWVQTGQMVKHLLDKM